MASFDYRLNPLYPIKECSSSGALYTTDYCCSEGSLRDKIIYDLDKITDLSQQSPQNYPKCGNPVDGHYCQGCALLRKKFKEDLFTSCVENGILQDSSEPSNDNTNIVNALREPFVVNQDHDKNSSQSPPQINHHCCYGCVLIVPNLEPFNNQTIKELPPTVPSFDPSCYSKEWNSFTYDSTSNIVHDSPNIFDPPPQLPFYSWEFYGNDARYGHYCTPQDPFIHPEQCYNQDFNFPQDFYDFQQDLCCDNCGEEEKQIEEEQAANARYWKILACYDDDDDEYTFEIIPNEPSNSLSMGGEHLDTIMAMESNEFIKYSVENLVPNPSESEESLLNHDSLIISSSLKINSLFDEFSGELTLLKSISVGINETDCDPEEETHFIKRLLYDNSSPCPLEEFVSENSDAEIKSFSTSPITVEDSDSLMEKIDLSFTPNYPMPPGIEEDDYDSERDILILEELLSNDSLSYPKNKSFHLIFLHPLVPMPRLMFTQSTLVPNQEKSPDFLFHLGHEAFQPSTECSMMIHGKNTPILDVPLFHFYPPDQF
nr:hypothetical protein [Tanacetum cinerariifolium]